MPKTSLQYILFSFQFYLEKVHQSYPAISKQFFLRFQDEYLFLREVHILISCCSSQLKWILPWNQSRLFVEARQRISQKNDSILLIFYSLELHGISVIHGGTFFHRQYCTVFFTSSSTATQNTELEITPLTFVRVYQYPLISMWLQLPYIHIIW